jgi:hypothetical protein
VFCASPAAARPQLAPFSTLPPSLVTGVPQLDDPESSVLPARTEPWIRNCCAPPLTSMPPPVAPAVLAATVVRTSELTLPAPADSMPPPEVAPLSNSVESTTVRLAGAREPLLRMPPPCPPVPFASIRL